MHHEQCAMTEAQRQVTYAVALVGRQPPLPLALTVASSRAVMPGAHSIPVWLADLSPHSERGEAEALQGGRCGVRKISRK